jgi:HK97 family phage portal protein
MLGFVSERRAREIAAEEARSSLENPSISLYDSQAWASIFGDWFMSASGEPVTYDSAMGCPPVGAAIRFISSTVASLPLDLFTKTDKGRVTADNNPLYALLSDAPNDELTSFQWRKDAMQNVLSLGRSVTFIERDKARRVKALWPLDPTKVTIKRVGGKKQYEYREDDRRVTYESGEVIDLPFMLKPDGITHIAPFDTFKNAIGLAIALEKYSARFFQNGGVPPLQLVGPIKSPAGVKRAATDITAALKAAKEDGRQIMPMPEMHELKPIGFDPEKSQLIDARKQAMRDIARIYQIPPSFLQDLEFGTFSNTEQQDLHFVKHTLMQWLNLWEQELNLKLFGARNTKNYVEFNVDGLLRGDFKTRMEGYSSGIQNAILMPNEVRRMENLPDAKFGDYLMVQGATVPLNDPAALMHRPKTDQPQPGDTVIPQDQPSPPAPKEPLP